VIDVAFFTSIKTERIKRLADHIEEFGVRIHIYNLTEHRNPLYLLRMISQLPNSTILATHESLMVPTTFLLARSFGYRYVYIQNGVLWKTWADAPAVYRNLRTILFKLILREASSVVCNSIYLSNELKSFYPHGEDKYIPIHNAIDIPKPLPSSEMFEFEEGFQHFVTMTNFEHPKKYEGLLHLIRAIDISTADRPVLHILSKVLRHSGLSNLHDFQGRMEGLESRVDLRFYPNADARRFLSPDINFLYCSLTGGDSFPRAVLEALALGVPSVIVETNGCTEAVFNKDMALVVTLDEFQIKYGIDQLLLFPEKRSKIMCAAPKGIRSQLSWRQMAKKYAYMFHSC